MSRFKLYAERIVNMVASPLQRGRGNILWLQSMVSPLTSINDDFQTYVDEKKIEANMTSTVMHFSWYLNRKFNQYFISSEDKIKFAHYVDLGVPIFDDGELNETYDVVWEENEDWSGAAAEEQPNEYYDEHESLDAIGASFKIVVPPINMDESMFDVMLKAEVERYRLVGKTYIIEHN